MTRSPPFRLQLFGTPVLLIETGDGGVEVALPAGKPLLILAHLSAHPEGGSRELLATLGWGDQNDRRARASLRQVVYRLRQILGPDSVRTTDETITLAVRIPSDRDDFLAAITAGDDAGAVALYRGPFLDGLVGNDADGLGPWDIRERNRLAALWREASLREGQRRLDAGDRAAAAALAERLTEAFPERSAVWAFRLAATRDPAMVGAHRDALAQLEAALSSGTLIGAEVEAARQLLDAVRAAPARRTHRPPTHPGEMLREEFLVPIGITQSAFATRLGVSFPRLNEIINGKRGVTLDTALRLARVLGMSAEFWLGLQQDWDLWHALRSKDAAEIARLEPIHQR